MQLRKLDKSEGTALQPAAGRLTNQLISDGKIIIAIERDSDVFLEKMDTRFLPYLLQMTDEIINGMTMRLIEKLTEELVGEIVRETLEGTSGEHTTIGMQSPENHVRRGTINMCYIPTLQLVSIPFILFHSL
ncbi:uncharacterized protein LOC119639560 [Glossina fuscipes]|uniref:Uncharacterized protein LOC119639560 n=1 Tax=Glossina fuscipes TaxID=7396 RepID=A0A9C5Z4I3_9MUSC|nr:uncharacterized protein LOC119639560 [Glossina fuscipes]